MNKTKLFLFSLFFTNACISQAFIDTLPIYASDTTQSMQGLKQLNGANTYIWERPGLDNADLNKLIGAIAIDPNNLNKVFFSVNTQTNNKLYLFNKTTGNEIDLGVSFTAAGSGTNNNSMPLISGEDVFGITMMTIDKVLNIGYALSKNNTLYSFLTSSPYTITNLGTVSNVPANSIAFTAIDGGGLTVGYTSNLVALVNIKVPIIDTFKYVFYEINPQDLKARMAKQTYFTFYGFFAGPHNFVSGFAATTNGKIYASLYDGEDSGIYEYNVSSNTFETYFTSFNQSVGDMTGAGIVTMASNILSTQKDDINATYNSETNKTKVIFSYETNKAIQKSIVQASGDGLNFIDINTLWITNKNNNIVEVNAQSVPNPSKKQYYRVATTFIDGTTSLSKSVYLSESFDESKNMSLSIYPNPTTNLINVILYQKAIIKYASIVDLNGKLIAKFAFNNLLEQNNIQIEVGKYLKQRGNYLLKIQTSKGLITKSFGFR